MSPVEKLAAGRLAGLGRALKTFATDYAGPLAVGAYTQHQLTQPHGDIPAMDPVSAAFFATGAGAVASPRDWAHVWRSRKSNPALAQPTNMLAAAKPLAITKLQFAGAGAGAGLLQQLTPMIKNISDTTKHVSNITKNVESGSSEIPGLAKQISTDTGNTTRAIAEGANQLKNTISEASPQIAGNLVDASKNVKGTSAGLDKIVDQVSQAAGSVNDVANMVKDPAIQAATGNAVRSQTNFMDSASNLMDGIRKHAPAIGASALGLGGGYLLLKWLNDKRESDRRAQESAAMFPARYKAAGLDLRAYVAGLSKLGSATQPVSPLPSPSAISPAASRPMVPTPLAHNPELYQLLANYSRSRRANRDVSPPAYITQPLQQYLQWEHTVPDHLDVVEAMMEMEDSLESAQPAVSQQSKAAASVDVKIRKPISRVIRSGGPGSAKWQAGHTYQGAQTKAANESMPIPPEVLAAIDASKKQTNAAVRTALPIAGGAAGMGSGLMLGSSLGAMLGAHRGNTVAGVGRGAIRGAGIGAGAGAGLGLGAAVLSKLQDSGVDIKEPLMLAGIPLAGAAAGGMLGHSVTDSVLGSPKDENTAEASPATRGLVTGIAGALPGYMLGGPTGAAIAGLGSGAYGYLAQRNRQQEYRHKMGAANDCGEALASLTNRTKTITRSEASATGPHMITKLRELSA